MYLIDVSAVDGDSGIEEIVSFAWDGDRLSREHEDGHLSSAGFASSIGGALDKALIACYLVGLIVVDVTIRREESYEVSNGYGVHQGLSGGLLSSSRADSARIHRAFDFGIVEEADFIEEA